MQFSIAVPVFNQANFLSFNLESIRVQSQNVQLAIMDATVDDSVQNVLKKYQNMIFYSRHGADEGQTSAIQEGWDKTNGEIVSWLCADDYYFPDTLDAVKHVFANNPDVDIVYGDSVFVDGSDNFFGYFPEIKTNIESILKGSCISQPSCFVRRSALDKIGKLNSKLHYIMDWDLWTRLYHSGARFQYINKPLSVVRMYDGTKTSSRSWRRVFEINRHLWWNTTPIFAVRSMVGFYHQDLLSNKVGRFEKIILNAMNFYRKQKYQLLNYNRPDKIFNYGLSPYNNEVANRVEIFLPWYSQNPPKGISVSCDLENAPEASLNGSQLSIKNGAKYCYEIPVIDFSSHLLHLQLSSPGGIKWHLNSVGFR